MKFKHFSFSLLLAINCLLLSEIEIRKIIPPKLNEENLGKKILCYRPMRRECPRMEVEFLGDKVVAHNYGHGGSGWTLGPGSANYVNDLLLKKCPEITKETPITIIGAGILGLFTAYDLVNKGFTNLTIVADKTENLTSHNAGGLIAPVSMDNDPRLKDIQNVIEKVGIDAYKFYESIAKNQNSIIKDGAIIVPTYFRNREESGLEPYVGKVMQPAKDVVLDFSNGKTQVMVSYDDGIFVNTPKLMTELNKYLKPLVKFEKKHVNSFSEIETKYIINCSGLGSKNLNNDNKMVSVQGHLIMLKDQEPKDLNYMLLVYFDESKNKNGQKVKRSFYIFPKQLENAEANDIGVVGGTFIENADESTPNEEEFDTMISNAKKFYGIG